MTGIKDMMIQPRDLAILRELAMMRVANREQVKLACAFGSITRVNARLLALTEAGLLRRYFLGEGAGRKALYALSEKGARLIDVPLRGPRRRQNETLVADYYVGHQLAVNEVYCTLKFRPIPFPQVAFRRWMSFHETIAPSLRLIPDGYVELGTPDGILAAFLEVDLGHESMAVWKEKTRQYLQLAVSGDFSRRVGQSRFRVLVLASSMRREKSIRATVAAQTEKIFWFATIEAVSKCFFGAVWTRPADDHPQTFIQEHP
jgi:hypothetical protein